MTDREIMQQALRVIKQLVVDESDDAPALQGSRMRKLGIEKALRERLAQPEQEPVAWITPHGEGFRIRFSPPTSGVPLGWDALYTTPPAAQPAMFGPMGTVGDLFDKHVIANGNLKKEWIVYLKRNT